MLRNDRWWFGTRLKFDDERRYEVRRIPEHPDESWRSSQKTQEFFNNTGVFA